MALSDTTIRQAKAVAKACTLGDTDGLALAVTRRQQKLALSVFLEQQAEMVVSGYLPWNPPQRSPHSSRHRL